MNQKIYIYDAPAYECTTMVKHYQRLDLSTRAEKFLNFMQAGRELMLAGIVSREPDISNDDAMQRLKELLYRSYQL